LSPVDRVKACKDLVETKCPRVFGNDYTVFQANREIECGDQRFDPVKVPATPAVEATVKEYGTDCQDDDAALQQTVTRILAVNPSMEYFFNATEKYYGLVPGTITHKLLAQWSA